MIAFSSRQVFYLILYTYNNFFNPRLCIVTFMKFQKLEALERHFKDSFPNHLCPIYLIYSSSDSERKKIMESLSKKLETICDLKRCSSLKDAVEHLNGSSLFSEKVAALFDGVELLLKNEIELLNHYIEFPNPSGCFILGSSNPKQVAEFYKIGKKEVVFLDLAKEKPWEEKQRLQKWIIQVLQAKKLSIRPEAVEILLEQFPSNRLLLQQELDKLQCYIGDRTEILREDVKAVCFNSSEINHFQLARDLVWGSVQNLPKLTDLATILPLISQLRFQLEMGLKMAAMVQKRIPQSEISAAFPRLFPKILQANLQIAKKRGVSYFKEGLKSLYDFELGIKTSRAKPEILFSLFTNSL